MKPCSKNRKLIAWLVLGSLETERAIPLRKHIETCAGCRNYLAGLTNLTATIKATEQKTDIQATAAFHQKVTARVKEGEQASLREVLQGTLLNWRVALPAAVGLAVVFAVWLLSPQQPYAPSPTSSSATVTAATKFDSDLEPTIAYYRTVANQSLEQLDQLLNEQGSRNLPPAPIYTASALVIVSKMD